MKIDSTAVIGAGGWGTALAGLWAKDGRDIVLWGHNGARVEQLRSTRENREYLPGFKLPETVRVTRDLDDGAKCDLIAFVLPSTAFRTIATEFRKAAPDGKAILLSGTKGI